MATGACTGAFVGCRPLVQAPKRHGEPIRSLPSNAPARIEPQRPDQKEEEEQRRDDHHPEAQHDDDHPPVQPDAAGEQIQQPHADSDRPGVEARALISVHRLVSVVIGMMSSARES